MARRHSIILKDENLRIPEDAFTFEGFQRWVESDEFPERGRIDYLGGDVESDMSPEDLYTHGAVKTEITLTLGSLVVRSGLGSVFVDSTRVTSRFAGLSVEPDIVVILKESVKKGHVRFTPASPKRPDRFSGLDGAVDLVIEVVSDGSKKKDTERLPRLYARAGVPEFWLADARGGDLSFRIHTLQGGTYSAVEPDSEGWSLSPLLGYAFRLLRRRDDPLPWYYILEAAPRRLP